MGRRYSSLVLFLILSLLALQVWVVVLPGLQTPEAHTYLGFPHLPTDHSQYQMIASQACAPWAPFYRNLYTTQLHEPRFLLMSATFSGWLAQIFHLPDPVAWHLVRVLAVAALSVVIWHLCLTLFHSGPRALIVFAALLFYSGLDWAYWLAWRVGLVQEPSASSWAANPWNFSFFWCCTIATWVWPQLIICSMLLWELRRNLWYGRFPLFRHPMFVAFIRGLSVAVLWAFHPYSALAWALFVMFLCLFPPLHSDRCSVAKRALYASPSLLGLVLVVIYNLWALEDPVYATTSAQVKLWRLSYPPYLWPLAFGPHTLLATFGLTTARSSDEGFRLIRAWFLVVLLACVNPFVTNAKFVFLSIVPLGLLTARGAFRMWDYCASGGKFPRLRWILASVLGLLLVVGTVRGIVLGVGDPRSKMFAYSDNDTLRLLAALRELPEGSVLCAAKTGLLVPWLARKPVFVGHWFLSARYYEKAALVSRFFAEGVDAREKVTLLEVAGIRWVLYGPEEAKLGPQPNLPGLEEVWSFGRWAIWEWKGGSEQAPAQGLGAQLKTPLRQKPPEGIF